MTDERGSRSSIIAACLANVGMAAAKFVAWGFTGSAAMLAEAVHSVADTGNQGLLLLGRHRADRTPSRRHPFGYGRERYFWSFVVAVVLFSMGSLFALVEGEEKLRHPEPPTSFVWAVGVLLLGLVFEGLSLRTALREGRGHKRAGERWPAFVRRTSVPELAVIILEDTGAIVGLLFALVGTTLAELTGVARFDAVGSLAIGLLLAAIAYTLASEMKSMLIGESATSEELARICTVIRSNPATRSVDDVRTELVGPDELLVVGTISVDAELAADLDAVTADLESRIRDEVPKARLIYLRTHS